MSQLEDKDIFSWVDETGKPICIEIAIVEKDEDPPCLT